MKLKGELYASLDLHSLHEGWVEGLVIPLEVDPSSHSLNGLLPLSRVAHDLAK